MLLVRFSKPSVAGFADEIKARVPFPVVISAWRGMGRGLEMESQMRKPLKRQSVFRAQTLPSEAIRTIEKLKSSKTEIPAKAREDGCMAIQEDMAQQPIVIPGLPPVQQAAWGFWLSQTIYVAAKLGIADLVEDGPKTSEELARAAGADASALHRV